jgi:hypothetical protein
MYPSNLILQYKTEVTVYHSLREFFECCLVLAPEIMGAAGLVAYSRMLYISWFFAACSLTCFGWYVILIMQEGQAVSINFFL